MWPIKGFSAPDLETGPQLPMVRLGSAIGFERTRPRYVLLPTGEPLIDKVMHVTAKVCGGCVAKRLPNIKKPCYLTAYVAVNTCVSLRASPRWVMTSFLALASATS